MDIDVFNIDTEFDAGIDATGFAGWLTKLGLAGILSLLLSRYLLFLAG